MTRRSISIRSTTFDRLRTYCNEHDRSSSSVVEELLAELLEIPRPKPRTRTAEQAKTDRLRFNPPPVKIEGVPKLSRPAPLNSFNGGTLKSSKKPRVALERRVEGAMACKSIAVVIEKTEGAREEDCRPRASAATFERRPGGTVMF